MKNVALIIKCSVFIVFLSTFNISIVHAQEDLGLCPPGYDQGIVSTGFVECYRESSRRSTREQAELERLQREAICNANPNSAVTSSNILGTPSGGFFSMVTCTVTREIPPGTVLCPDNSEEVYRAFDVLICQNFGSASATAEEAQAALNTQVAECTAAIGGRVVDSELSEETFDDVTFFSSSLACAFATAATDVIECPFGFDERSRDEDSIECLFSDRSYESIEEAQEANTATQGICTGTTAGLGRVTEFLVGETSNDRFFSMVECTVNIPRFGEFSDQSTLRACDASCTEEVQQARPCLNGGQVGGPGCIGPGTQVVEQRCNTGIDRDGLCPLVIVPEAIVAPLLLDDDD